MKYPEDVDDMVEASENLAERAESLSEQAEKVNEMIATPEEEEEIKETYSNLKESYRRVKEGTTEEDDLKALGWDLARAHELLNRDSEMLCEELPEFSSTYHEIEIEILEGEIDQAEAVEEYKNEFTDYSKAPDITLDEVYGQKPEA